MAVSKCPCLTLKEQYPVTAHAPNFDFRTGCREIKRCKESKRTLKNPFASRLAELDTTLKLLRIRDQWYIVPVKFRFGRNREFLALLSLPLTRRPKDGKRLPIEGLFLLSTSIQVQKLVQWNHNVIFDWPFRWFIALRLHFYLYLSNVWG